ncbi:hypothetical protein GCM10008965_54590 [Methylorubrum aminovorans]|nr:hypothetical protein GCM10025880_15130 [Methylorubrum aminovorans]
MGREGNEEEKDEEGESEEEEAEGGQKHVGRHRVPEDDRSRQTAPAPGTSPNVTSGPARHKHPRRRDRRARGASRAPAHGTPDDAARSHPAAVTDPEADKPCNIVTFR